MHAISQDINVLPIEPSLITFGERDLLSELSGYEESKQEGSKQEEVKNAEPGSDEEDIIG